MIQNISRTTHSINHGFNIDNHPSCPGYDGDPPRYPGHTSLPPPRYSSACQASQRSSSKRDTIKSLGVIGVIIGPICVFLSVSLILISGPSSYFRVPYIGCGIWGGILFFIAGSVVRDSRNNATKIYILFTLILSVFVSLVVISFCIAEAVIAGKLDLIRAVVILLSAIEFIASTYSCCVFCRAAAARDCQNVVEMGGVPNVTYNARSRVTGLHSSNTPSNPRSHRQRTGSCGSTPSSQGCDGFRSGISFGVLFGFCSPSEDVPSYCHSSPGASFSSPSGDWDGGYWDGGGCDSGGDGGDCGGGGDGGGCD